LRALSPAALVLAALLAAALVVRPLVHGVPASTILVFWAAVLGQVVVPGVLVCRGARLCPPTDGWLLLGQGATLGLALQGLAMLAGRALGAAWLPAAAALGAAAVGLALEKRAAEGPPAAASPAPALTLAVVLTGALLQPLASAERVGSPLPFDLLFHAGTAGELRHRWPLEDPRVSGVPLHYHLLAYALPVEAADLAGAPLADPLFALAPLLWVSLLALQAANAGRVLFGDGRAGAFGAAVVLLHTDPGRFLGLAPGAFNSHLATGIYGSPTTVCGLILLAGLAVSLEAWITRGGRRHLAAVCLLAAAASGAKTTVLPVVLGGLALAALRALALRQPAELRRWVAAFAVAAVAGAPLTLWQTQGEESYSGMARLGLGVAFSSSGFAAAAGQSLGSGAVSGLAALPALAVWLVGYLGLAGVAAGLWLVRRKDRLSPIQAWALGLVGAGVAASLLLDVPGLSQLFLLYNGQLLLGLFAGAGLAQALRRPRGLPEIAAASALALAALPTVDHLARALPAAHRADAAAAAWTPSPVERDYSEGLAWLRAHASRGAVVWADNPSLLLSAFGEVRLYHENGLYSARAWRVGPSREPWPERVALQERLLRRPDAAAVAEARRAVGPGPRLLVVADAVQSRVEAGLVVASLGAVPPRFLLPEELFTRRFRNGALHVYEAREDDPRR
jgi:hypothetical protein